MDSRVKCSFDVMFEKVTKASSKTDEDYYIRISDSVQGIDACISSRKFIEFQAKTFGGNSITNFSYEVKEFSIYAIMIMILLIFYYEGEINKYE